MSLGFLPADGAKKDRRRVTRNSPPPSENPQNLGKHGIFRLLRENLDWLEEVKNAQKHRVSNSTKYHSLNQKLAIALV